MARAILSELAHGHEARNNQLLADELVAKATGAERVVTLRETTRWLQQR